MDFISYHGGLCGGGLSQLNNIRSYMLLRAFTAHALLVLQIKSCGSRNVHVRVLPRAGYTDTQMSSASKKIISSMSAPPHLAGLATRSNDDAWPTPLCTTSMGIIE